MATKKENKTKDESREKAEPKKEAKNRNAKGQFEKGRKKTGGRQLGTKNKYSNVRDRLKEKIEPFLDRLDEMIELAEKQDGAAAALAAIEKFLPYFTPKFSAVSIGADQDRPLSEEEALMELDAKYKKQEVEIKIKSLTIVNNDNLPDDDGFEDDYEKNLLVEADD